MIFSKSQPQHPSINQNLRNVIEFGYLKFYVGGKIPHFTHNFCKDLKERKKEKKS